MMSYLVSLLINAVIVLIAAYIMPKVEVKSFGAALLVAFLIGLLNPVFSFFLHVLTLGLPLLIGLGFIIRWIAAAIVIKIVDAIMPGFKVHGFTTALILSAIIAIIGTLVERMLF